MASWLDQYRERQNAAFVKMTEEAQRYRQSFNRGGVLGYGAEVAGDYLARLENLKNRAGKFIQGEEYQPTNIYGSIPQPLEGSQQSAPPMGDTSYLMEPVQQRIVEKPQQGNAPTPQAALAQEQAAAVRQPSTLPQTGPKFSRPTEGSPYTQQADAAYAALQKEILGYVPGQSVDAQHIDSFNNRYIGAPDQEQRGDLVPINTPRGGYAMVPAQAADQALQRYADERRAEAGAAVGQMVREAGGLGQQAMSRKEWEQAFPESAKAQKEYENRKLQLQKTIGNTAKSVGSRKAAEAELAKISADEARAQANDLRRAAIASAKEEKAAERQQAKDLKALEVDIKKGSLNAKTAEAYATALDKERGETLTNLNAMLIQGDESGKMSKKQLDTIYSQFKSSDQFAQFLQDAHDLMNSGATNKYQATQALLFKHLYELEPKKK